MGIKHLETNTVKPVENFNENLNLLKLVVVCGREHYYYISSKAQSIRDHSSVWRLCENKMYNILHH